MATEVQTTINQPVPDYPEAPQPDPSALHPDEQEGEAEETSETPDPEQQTQPEDETIVTIGDEPPEDAGEDKGLIRHLRKTISRKEQQFRDLEAKVQQLSAAQQPVAELGPEPTLEGCKWNDEQYAAALKAYYDQRIERERQQWSRQQEVERQNQQFAAKQTATVAAGRKIAPDYEERVSVVESILSRQQAGIITHQADRPELVMLALAHNPSRARQLAAETDPLLFGKAVTKLELQLKVAKRTPATAPEQPVNGNARHVAASTSTLDRLLDKGRRTSDFTDAVRALQQRRAGP